MNALEQLVLRIADHDWNWVGLNWMRPTKRSHIGIGYILFSSFFLGIPGVAACTGMLYLTFGKVEPKLWLAFFILVMLMELALHILFAWAWNRRSRQLAEGQT